MKIKHKIVAGLAAVGLALSAAPGASAASFTSYCSTGKDRLAASANITSEFHWTRDRVVVNATQYQTIPFWGPDGKYRAEAVFLKNYKTGAFLERRYPMLHDGVFRNETFWVPKGTIVEARIQWYEQNASLGPRIYECFAYVVA